MCIVGLFLAHLPSPEAEQDKTKRKEEAILPLALLSIIAIDNMFFILTLLLVFFIIDLQVQYSGIA